MERGRKTQNLKKKKLRLKTLLANLPRAFFNSFLFAQHAAFLFLLKKK